MIIDSSAWVDYIRGADTSVVPAVAAQLRAGTAATTDAVRTEVLAGAWRGVTPEALSALLDYCVNLAQVPREDVEQAAVLYRTCRANGETVRALNDCLIAAVALRCGEVVLHRDRDFDVIAKYSDLQVTSG